MRKLFTQDEIANIMNRSKDTVHRHIRMLDLKPFKKKNRFLMYEEKVIDILEKSINKREVVRYYPMRTTETFYIYESKLNSL